MTGSHAAAGAPPSRTPPPAVPPDADPSRELAGAGRALPPHYFSLPGWVNWPAGLALVALGVFFLTGTAITLLQPVDPQTVADLPLEGWPQLTFNSLAFSLCAAMVSLGLALPVGLSLRHAAAGMARWAPLAVVAGLAAVPWIVTATGWTQAHYLLAAGGPDSAGAAWAQALEQLIKHPTAAQTPIRLVLGAAMQGALGAPLAVLLLAALLPLPSAEEEAALLVGTRRQVWRHVTLPAAALPLQAGFAVMLLWHFNELTICDLLRINTWSTRVFMTTAGLSPALALREYLWMAALNAGAAGLLFGALTRLARRRAGERLEFEPLRSRALRPAGLVRYGGWAVFTLVGGLAPFAVLLARLGQSSDATWPAMRACVGNSAGAWSEGLQVAFGAGALALGLGLMLGVLSVGRERGLRWLAWSLTGLFLAMASIGISLPLKALSQHLPGLTELRGTHFFEAAACALRAAPWVALLTVWQLYQLPRSWDEAARTDGADASAAFRHVLLPYLKPLLPVGFFLGFALASLDLAPAVLLAPPGRQTLIVVLFNELHYDYNANLIVIALLIAAPFPLLALPLASWFGWRARTAF